MALPPQFRKKVKESKEPKGEERKEAKLSPKARAAMERKEATPFSPGFKRGGSVKKCA